MVSAVGAISGWIAHHTTWIVSYGAIGWWATALVGALIATAVLVGVAYLRLIWIKGAAIRNWQKEVTQINPLDAEFTRQRISISDLVSPVTRGVSKKRFVDCELLGPANIVFRSGINANGTGFVDCDIVVIRPNGAFISNVVPFDDVQIFGGVVHRCTIYMPDRMVDDFAKMGGNFVSMTGHPDLDSRVSRGPPAVSHPSPAPPDRPERT